VRLVRKEPELSLPERRESPILVLLYTGTPDYGGSLFDLFKKTELGVKRSKETWFGKIANIFKRGSFGDEVWEELEVG